MKPRFGKRHGTSLQKDRDGNSTSLRTAIDLIQHRNISDGLKILDQLASKNLAPDLKIKILSATGDCQLRRFDHTAAIAAYAKAESMASKNPRGWLRPAIGQLQVYLNRGDFNEAYDKANGIFERTLSEERSHAQDIAQATNAEGTGQVASFKGLPHRVSYIGSRLGNLFLNNGFPEIAADFFNRTIENTPNGASRSRLGLAEVAAREQHWEDSCRFALDAIQIGKFRRKTLPAISVYLTAAAARGTPVDTEVLVGGFLNVRRSVRDHAFFIIITSLRSMRQPEWNAIAKKWLSIPNTKDKILETELRKLLLAEARLLGATSAEIASRTRELIQSDNLRFSEWSFAAREMVKIHPGVSQNMVQDQVEAAAKRFGEKYRYHATHRLARAVAETGREDISRALLFNAFKKAPRSNSAWGKIAWNCGMFEEKAENFGSAALYFYAIYAQPTTPSRFQFLGLIGWARNLMKAGQSEAILEK